MAEKTSSESWSSSTCVAGAGSVEKCMEHVAALEGPAKPEQSRLYLHERVHLELGGILTNAELNDLLVSAGVFERYKMEGGAEHIFMKSDYLNSGLVVEKFVLGGPEAGLNLFWTRTGLKVLKSFLRKLIEQGDSGCGGSACFFLDSLWEEEEAGSADSEKWV